MGSHITTPPQSGIRLAATTGVGVICAASSFQYSCTVYPGVVTTPCQCCRPDSRSYNLPPIREIIMHGKHDSFIHSTCTLHATARIITSHKHELDKHLLVRRIITVTATTVLSTLNGVPPSVMEDLRHMRHLKINRHSVSSLLSKLSLVQYPAKREIIMHGDNERSLHSTSTLHSTAHILTPQKPGRLDR